MRLRQSELDRSSGYLRNLHFRHFSNSSFVLLSINHSSAKILSMKTQTGNFDLSNSDCLRLVLK